MKRQFVVGVIGGGLGIVSAVIVIATSGSAEITLSGVQAALFSSLGLMGAAMVHTQNRFAGWMFLSSAVWIALSVPLAGTFYLLYGYLPAILLLAVAAVLCFLEPEDVEVDGEPEESA